MKILVINGKARSGKDTFCKYAYDNRGLVYPVSTVDKVKQVAMLAGWHGEKDEKSRKFLSDLKDAMTDYNDMPREYVIDFMKLRIVMHEASVDDIIFLVQSREPEDIQRWVDINNARTVHISRPGTEQIWGNHADDNVDNYVYDYYLVNDGTKEEWACKTIEFIDKIRKQEWESYV